MPHFAVLGQTTYVAKLSLLGAPERHRHHAKPDCMKPLTESWSPLNEAVSYEGSANSGHKLHQDSWK